MPPVYLYSWVEDKPSAEIAKVLVRHANRIYSKNLHFKAGFPAIKNGFGDIKKRMPSFMEMARNGIPLLVLTDLDQLDCPPTLIRDWLRLPPAGSVKIPDQFAFRVAVREVESWILADREAFAKFLGIAVVNIPSEPEQLDDPKQHLLNIIKKKGRKKWNKEMLPQNRTSSIGPQYNEKLCKFISEQWDPGRAEKYAPSLARAIRSLEKIRT